MKNIYYQFNNRQPVLFAQIEGHLIITLNATKENPFLIFGDDNYQIRFFVEKSNTLFDKIKKLFNRGYKPYKILFYQINYGKPKHYLKTKDSIVTIVITTKSDLVLRDGKNVFKIFLEEKKRAK